MTQMRCETCGHIGPAREIACLTPLVCPNFAVRQIEGKLPAGAPAIPPMVCNTANRTPTEPEYDDLRAQLDEIGIRSMEFLVEHVGMDAKTAGERIAEFNDLVIAAVRRRYGVRK